MPKQQRHRTSYPGVYFIEGTSPATGKPERIYYIFYRVHGKQVEEKAGRQYKDDMTAAKAALIRAQRIEGNQPTNRERRVEAVGHSPEKWTLDRLYEVFIQHKSHLKSLKDDKIRYNLHLHDIIGQKTVTEITPFDIEAIRTSLLQNHQPATVKQVLVLLLRIVNYCAADGLCSSLKFKIEMPKVNNQKTEDLSPTQLHRLLKVLEEHPDRQAANIMKLALYTGMRRSELLRLQWDHIDFERGFIRLVDPKSGRDQVIPLNDASRKVLHDHPRISSSYVFPGRKGEERINIAKALKSIKEKASLPVDFRPLHGLRHVFASMLASSGQVDMYTLQKLLTHKSPQMTQRYAHLRDETLKNASNLVGELVNQAINREKDKKVVNLHDYKK